MSETGFNWNPEHPRLLADLTGDGRADIIGFGPDGVWVALNNGKATFESPKHVIAELGFNNVWQVAKHPRFLTDLTGDGRADIVGFGDDGVWVALNNGNGTFQAPKFVAAELGFNSGWRVDRHPRFLTDLTGDGRADIVGFGDDGVWVALNNGNGTFQAAKFVLTDLGFNKGGWRVDQHPRFLADLTGDGLPDIVGFGNAGVLVAFNSGNGTFQAPKLVVADLGFNSGWRVDKHPRFLADLTGDRRADIVGFGDAGVVVALNNGNGTFQAPKLVVADLGFNSGWRVDKHPRFLADLTGDRRADIVGFGDAGVVVALNNGNGTFQAPKFVAAELGFNRGWRVDRHARFPADLTGDGRADIVGFGDDGVWVALNNGNGTFQAPRFTLKDFGGNSNRDEVIRGEVIRSHSSSVKHVFVLMLENRSFDHMLGFSGITGTDATTGQPTTMDGLKGTEGNSFQGQRHTVRRGAADVIRKENGELDDIRGGPGHDFADVLEQLCGPRATYPSRGVYPEVNNTGFVSSYAKRGGGKRPEAAKEAMECFGPEHLTVLNALAREFVVCDRWFSSMPGPTEPNRMFAHAATCGEFDDAPSKVAIGVAEVIPDGGLEGFLLKLSGLFDDIAQAAAIAAAALAIKNGASTGEAAAAAYEAAVAAGGFKFRGGTIFELLKKAGVKFRIYRGDLFPNVAQLQGIDVRSDDIKDFESFADDVNDSSFDFGYVFIEPAYDAFPNDFITGNSQHPLGSVAAGERLIKATYEAIRKSPIWGESLLIVTWDEHGGFYDHVAPGPAAAAGAIGRAHGFTFEQLGPRVPAVIVSPLIPKNLIEHHLLEHASIPATLIDLFNLPTLPHSREGRVSGVMHLCILDTPRTDAPLTLPAPSVAVEFVAKPNIAFSDAVALEPNALLSKDPDDSLASLIRGVVVQHLQVAPNQREAILARSRLLRTHGDLLAYMKEVHGLVRAERVKAGLVHD